MHIYLKGRNTKRTSLKNENGLCEVVMAINAYKKCTVTYQRLDCKMIAKAGALDSDRENKRWIEQTETKRVGLI